MPSLRGVRRSPVSPRAFSAGPRRERETELRALGRPLTDGGPGPFYDIAIGPTGVAAAAGDDGAVHLWDVRTQVPAGRLVGHRGSVTAVAFGPDGVLASAGDDTTIRFWDVASQRASNTFCWLPPLKEPIACRTSWARTA